MNCLVKMTWIKSNFFSSTHYLLDCASYSFLFLHLFCFTFFLHRSEREKEKKWTSVDLLSFLSFASLFLCQVESLSTVLLIFWFTVATYFHHQTCLMIILMIHIKNLPARWQLSIKHMAKCSSQLFRQWMCVYFDSSFTCIHL